MKKYLYAFIFAIFALASCSSDKDEQLPQTYDFNCAGFWTLDFDSRLSCQFFFFPEGDYVGVERNSVSNVSALPWNTYAITSTGSRVASVMNANYNYNENNGKSVKPYAVNGYTGKLNEGTFYVVAIPYVARDGGVFALSNKYIARTITKQATEVQNIYPEFYYGDIRSSFDYEGESTILTRVDDVADHK